MPDKRTHRGPHPQDEALFATDRIVALRSALTDLCLLRTKGYAEKSSLTLVGDRFCLTQRQRLALMRSSCSDEQLARRRTHEVPVTGLADRALALDGYNVLITVESAMSGGFLFRGRDGCLRDLASIHGTYRKVAETVDAIRLIGEILSELGVADALWLLDSPVSNSGRLKALIQKMAGENGWPWQAQLSINPDAALGKTDRVVATSDSVVLGECEQWTNLAGYIIAQRLPDARVIDLSD